MQNFMSARELLSFARLECWPNHGPRVLTFRRQALRACNASNPERGVVILASTVKEGRKSTSGVKGEDNRTGSSRSGGTSSSRTTSGRKEGSGSTRPGAPQQRNQAKQAPQQPQQSKNAPQLPPRQQQQRRSSSSASQPPAVSNASRLDSYMRRHPLLSRFYDTTLLLGDCVMILATEASSERIEWSSFPILVSVLLICWVAAGAMNGDYSPGGSRAHEDVPWQLSMLGPTFGSILGAALTWAFASTASVGVYAVLVACNVLDAAPVVEGLNTDDLSPQLEVVVALLVTMTCWRGIASKLRPTPPGGSE